MKKSSYLFTAATSVAVLIFIYPKSENPPVKVKVPREMKEIFMGKRSVPVAYKAEDKVYSGCEELESTLNDLDFRRPAEEWVTTLELRELSACKDPSLEKQLLSANNICFSKKPNHNECVQNLLFLRSLLRTRHEIDANDPENIADLIIREFATNIKEPNFQKLSEYADKLIDMNPSNIALQKFWAMSKLMSNIRSVPEGLQDEIYARIDPSLLSDPDFMSYRMFLETQLDPLKAEGFSRDYLAQYPDQSQAHEMLGWSLWQQGKRDEARAQLDLAIQMNPNDEYLKAMAKDLRSRKADRGSYKGRMNMGISFEDLFD